MTKGNVCSLTGGSLSLKPKNLGFKFSVSVVLSLLSLSAQADFIRRSGISIDLKTKEKVAYRAAEKATIEGEYCRVSVHHKTWIKHCLGLPDHLIGARYYYPDLAHEVTSQVQLSKSHKTRLFSFETPELSVEQTQAFYVVLGKPDHKIDHLMRIEAKLVRRIEMIENLLSHFHKRHKKEENHKVELLTALKNTLEAVRTRIAERLNRAPNIIAQRSLPIQVDNQYVLEPTRYATLLGNFEFALGFTPGSAIQGEQASVQAKITNLNEISSPFKIDDGEEGDDGDDGKDPKEHRTWSAKVYFNNELIHEFEPKKLASGESFLHEFTTPKLLPTEKNEIKIELFKKTGFYGHWKKHQYRYGKLTLSIPTAEDKVAPKFISPNTLESHPRYAQQMNPIEVHVLDGFGLMDESTLNANLSGTLTSGSAFNEDVTHLLTLTKVAQGQEYIFSGLINNLLEGEYVLELSGSDLAGNAALPNPLSKIFRIDRTPPEVVAGEVPSLTNVPAFELPVTITDFSPVHTIITNNGLQVFETDALSFNAAITFLEGENQLVISSVDAAQNVKTLTLPTVVLDTIPPVLSNLTPAPESILFFLNFPVSGLSNEKLSKIKLNGAEIPLSEDKLSFASTYQAMMEGPVTLSWEATDLATNVSQVDVPIEIVLKVLNGELISVVPDLDGIHYRVVGAPGASRNGAEITARASFLNQGSTIAKADGSFEIKLSPFTEAEVTGFDPNLNRTDTATVTFQVDTRLSGVVRDKITSQPLPGVSVKIEGGTEVVTTDGSGVFMFIEPANTGDQVLLVDGSSVPVEVAGDKKFERERISITVGLSQANVLPPIYLMGVSESNPSAEIIEGSGATVTDAAAPGVMINIPAGTTTFPDGSNSGKISIATVPAENATIAPPAFVEPEDVIAFAPSGTRFSEPVDVTVPNFNNLPDGVDVLFVSMDTSIGGWNIDGVGTVSGSEIQSKPGQGITHFSTLVAVPIFPETKPIAPGADTFNGALSVGISLPSFQSFGKTITPGLSYKSNWAKPTTLVTNVFDIPEREVNIIRDQSSSSSLFAVSVVTTSERTWWEPDKISTVFRTKDFVSEKLTQSGIPRRAAISYSMDLEHLDTGVYPYFAEYEVFLNRMSIKTTNLTIFTWFGMGPSVNQSGPATALFQKVFPSHLSGEIYIQNKMASSAGRGWRIQGAQRLYQVNQNKVFLEEPDGGVSVYSIDDSVTTLYDAEGTKNLLTQGVAINQWPKALIAERNDSTFLRAGFTIPRFVTDLNEVDLSVGESTENHFLTLPNTDATFVGNLGPFFDTHHFWNTGRFANLDVRPGQMIQLPDGSVFGTDNFGSSVFKISSGQFERVTGLPTVPTTITDFSCSRLQNTLNNHCLSYGGDRFGCVHFPACPQNFGNGFINSFGEVPAHGFIEGSLAQSRFNHPEGLTTGPIPNSIVVADRGNHRVRLVNFTENTVTTIAGNGSTTDFGDGGLATEAGIRHPQGVVYDPLGNLYISSEGGLIRKVDTSGVISTFAGNPSVGPSQSATRTQFFLSNPKGMVIDELNGFLYVADSGANKIVRIEFKSGEASVVAGTGTPGFNGDQKSALNANLNQPTWLALDDQQNLIFVDSGNKRIRRINFSNTSDGVLSFSSSQKDHSVLTKNGVQGWTRTMRNGTKSFFDPDGLQTSLLNTAGEEVTYGYDTNGNLLSQSDPSGRSITYSYSGSRLASITDPAGRTTSFTYTGEFLTQVNFPDGTKKKYRYDADGLMLGETNERGIETQYVFNDFSRLNKVIRPDLSEVIINDSGSATAANSYTGGTVGQMQTLGEGNATEQIIDAKGEITEIKKDKTGLIVFVVDPKGDQTQIKRDPSGKPIEIVRYNGNGDGAIEISHLTFEYNNCGDMISQTDSVSGIKTSQIFDNDENCFGGRVISQTNGREFTNYKEYDPDTFLLVAEENAIGQRVEWTYEPGTSLVATAKNVSLNQVTSFGYDTSGNLIGRTSPGERVTTYSRDLAGNILTRTNPKKQVTAYEYGLFNELLAVRTAVGTAQEKRTEYAYTSDKKIETVTDPAGNISSFFYNNLSQLERKKDVLGFETFFKYDVNGNLIEEIDPNGNLKKYFYDEQNRLVQRILPDNQYDYAYDERGNLVESSNQESILSFNYDLADRLTSATTQGRGSYSSLPNVTLAFNFDDNGNRILLADPTGDTTYLYDDIDRLVNLRNPNGENYSFNYDNGGRLNLITRPGSQTAVVFDETNFVTSLIHSSGSTDVSKFLYTRDELGNRLTKETLRGLTTLSYDAENQLTGSVSTDPELSAPHDAEAFQYDEVYNRTQDQSGSYSYDAKKQRLQEDYLFFYTYDNNGNLKQKQEKAGFPNSEVTQYQYSSENQLLSFKVFLGQSVLKEAYYVYDASGRRVQKQVIDHQASSDPKKTFTRRYVYDGQEILLEYNENNQLLARYTHSTLGMDDVLAVDVTSQGVTSGLAQNPGSYQFLKDSLGTITDVTDTSGHTVQHYVYSAFGKLLGIKDATAQDITSNPLLNTAYGFTGREFDSETGYYYYRARYYDPHSGRFLQRDPDPGQSNAPITSVNSYIYANNNPQNLIDPTGNFAWRDVFSFIKRAWIGFTTGLSFLTQLTDLFSENFIDKLIVVQVAASAAFVGGAVAGGLVGGSQLGAFVGSLVGSQIGGNLAGLGFEAFGLGSFAEGYTIGAIVGGFFGGLGGRLGFDAFSKSSTVKYSNVSRQGRNRTLAMSKKRWERVKDDLEKIININDDAKRQFKRDWEDAEEQQRRWDEDLNGLLGWFA